MPVFQYEALDANGQEVKGQIEALSGEEASFLAGGEFPIPVVQGTTTGGGTSISVEYREFGVRLSFRPTVLGDGSIRLYVAPEVSNLSDAGSVEMSGFRVPALVTRRASATLKLNSGETFAMAGLLNSTTNEYASVNSSGTVEAMLDRMIDEFDLTLPLADVLVGVTMQQKGVSKKISVTFDNVETEPQEATAVA